MTPINYLKMAEVLGLPKYKALGAHHHVLRLVKSNAVPHWRLNTPQMKRLNLRFPEQIMDAWLAGNPVDPDWFEGRIPGTPAQKEAAK